MIAYACAPDAENGSFFNPLAFYLVQKCMVSLKYASLTDSEYERFMASPDLATSRLYQSQMQLLTAIRGRGGPMNRPVDLSAM